MCGGFTRLSRIGKYFLILRAQSGEQNVCHRFRWDCHNTSLPLRYFALHQIKTHVCKIYFKEAILKMKLKLGDQKYLDGNLRISERDCC